MSNLKYFITSKAKRNVLYLFLRDTGKRYYTREVARLTGEPLNAVRRELGYLEMAGLLSSRVQGNLKYFEVVKTYPLLSQWRKIILESYTAPTPEPVTEPPPDMASEAGLTTGLAEAIAKIEARKQSPGAKHVIAKAESFKHIPVEDGDKAIIPGTRVIPNHESPLLPDVIELPGPANAGEVTTDIITASEAPEQLPEPQPRSILTLQSVVNYLSDQLKDISTINLALILGEAARSERIPESGIDLLIVGDLNRDMVMELIATFEDKTGININLTSMTRSDFDYRNARGDAFVRRIWGEKKLVVKGRQ